MFRALWCVVACVVLLASAPGEAADLTGWGVVALHGKWAPPGGGKKGIGATAIALHDAGAAVARPAMPWADGGTYVPYEQCLDIVAKEVAALRAAGARKIAIVGASIGGNVAIGYAALRRGVDAVVIMAPGHFPQAFATQTRDDLARAKASVAAGRGSEVGSYTDVNQRVTRQVHATAAGYVSFFDADGPANFSRYAGAGGTPLLWVIGRDDNFAQGIAGRSGGSVVTVNATHGEVPVVGARDVVNWLKGR